MKNKELQESRMRGYFMQATKGILKSEGLKGVSVRNIAKEAGYSYATLYNYFKDANDLVFLCVEDFFNECKEFVESKAKKKHQGIERLKATIIAYTAYFVEYPGVFDLFFLESIGDLGHKQVTVDLINHSFDVICSAEWDYCMSHNLISAENIEPMKSQLKYSVIGIMLMYLNRHTPQTYSKFVQLINEQVDFILESKTNESNKSVLPQKSGKQTIKNSLISVKIGHKR